MALITMVPPAHPRIRNRRQASPLCRPQKRTFNRYITVDGKHPVADQTTQKKQLSEVISECA